MSESLLKRAKGWRGLVLLAELAGWLHDLGKLSSGFVLSKTDRAYATGEGAEAGEWEEATPSEPETEWRHEQVFSDKEPYDGKRLPPPLKQALQRSLTGPKGWLQQGALGSENTTLEELVAEHQAPWAKLPALPWVQRLLVVADRDDSGEDQYNAVDLHQREPVQAATVFGREEPLAKDDLQALDEIRLALYPQLATILSSPSAPTTKREELWELLCKAMCSGLGKTQRATNDVRLDQHAWGVATRFKAFLMRDLLDLPPANQEYPCHTFRLLTVWWNWWELITPFARLSDVVGREVALKRLREQLRRVVEDEYALGNRVYEDDNGVHFLVADRDWGAELESLIRAEVNERTGGEAQPVVRLSAPTERVTDLVRQMNDIRKEIPPVGEPAWAAEWERTSSNEICPVCRRRPLEGDRDLCEWCEARRHDGIQQRLKGRVGTVWTGEIADQNGRVALIVAHFDLERWLDGTILHAVFITSPQDIAHLYPDMQDKADWRHLRAGLHRLKEESLKPLGEYRADVERARRKLQQSEQPQIPPKRRSAMRTEAEHQLQEAVAGFWAALIARERDRYKGEKGRHIREVMASLQTGYPQEDAFLLALARKNPSASRLLRVWQTTEDFLTEQAEGLAERVEERQRVVFTLEKPPHHSGIYTAEVPGLGRMDVFVAPEEDSEGRRKAQTIECLKPEDAERLRAVKTLHLVKDERGRVIDWDCGDVQAEHDSYLPYQVITVSPNLLLAMVPADRAMEVAEAMHGAYVWEFGKVQGRLPFHVGLIFMDAHYPMFAALDTARRLAETFDGLAKELETAQLATKKEEGDGYDLTLKSDRFDSWTWHVPARRGDGETDWYHPYFLVWGEQGLDERGMSLRGPEGRWVHVSQLEKGDQIAFWPNLFDFLFLDTVSRRLDAHADSDTGRRPHPLLGRRSPRPYLLERVSHLREVWERICKVPGMSETRLEGATALLARKWEEWGLAKSDEHKETWEWLARETVTRDFRGNQTILDAILDGTFFDVVELYRHILKKKVESKPSEKTEEAKR